MTLYSQNIIACFTWYHGIYCMVLLIAGFQLCPKELEATPCPALPYQFCQYECANSAICSQGCTQVCHDVIAHCLHGP